MKFHGEPIRFRHFALTRGGFRNAGPFGKGPLSEKSAFVLYYAIIWMTSSIVGPYLGVYYVDMGFSVFQIGLLSSVGALVCLFIQPLWGIASDRTRHPLQIVRAVFLMVGALVLLFLLGREYWHFLLISLIYSACSSAVMPLNDAYTLRYLNAHGLKFSHIRLAGTLGYAFSVFVLGRILGRADLTIIFFIGAAMNVLCVAATWMLPKVETPPKPALPEGEKHSAFANIGKVMDGELLLMLFFALIMQVALGFHGTFLSVYVKEMGCENSIIGVLQCTSALSEVPVLLLIDRVMRKCNVFRLLSLAGVIMVVRMLLYSLAVYGGVPVLIASQLLQGVTYMTLSYSCILYMSQKMPPHMKTTGQSLLQGVQGGLGSILANIGGGALGNALGIQKSYIVVAVMILCATGIFAFGMRKRIRSNT